VVEETEKVLETAVLPVGIMTIRTGSGAAYGVPYDTAQEISADEWNARGGLLVGDKRYIVDVDIMDCKYEVPIMLSIAEQFVNRKKYKFVATNGSPMIEVMDPVSAPQKVIHMSTTWHLEPCESAHTFCTMPTQFETAPKFFETMKKEQPQIKSVFYAGMNFTFDIGAAGLGKAVAIDAGYEWDDLFIEWPISDLLSVATGIIKKNPDLVLMGALAGDGPGFIRLMRDLGYEGVMGSLYAFPTIPQLMEAFEGGEEYLLENYYGVEENAYNADGTYADEDLQALIAEYSTREPGMAQSGIVTFYYTMENLLQTLSDTQTVTDTDKVAAALETTTWKNKFLPGDPTMSFGGAGKSDVPLTLRQKHIIWSSMSMNVYRDGKPETIEVFNAGPIGPLPDLPVVYTP